MRCASRTSDVVLGNTHILIARRKGVNETLSRLTMIFVLLAEGVPEMLFATIWWRCICSTREELHVLARFPTNWINRRFGANHGKSSS
jgi:hypothetical protein